MQTPAASQKTVSNLVRPHRAIHCDLRSRLEWLRSDPLRPWQDRPHFKGPRAPSRPDSAPSRRTTQFAARAGGGVSALPTAVRDSFRDLPAFVAGFGFLAKSDAVCCPSRPKTDPWGPRFGPPDGDSSAIRAQFVRESDVSRAERVERTECAECVEGAERTKCVECVECVERIVRVHTRVHTCILEGIECAERMERTAHRVCRMHRMHRMQRMHRICGLHRMHRMFRMHRAHRVHIGRIEYIECKECIEYIECK